MQAVSDGASNAAQLREKLQVSRVCGSCDDCLEGYLTDMCLAAPVSATAGAD